MTRKQRSEVTAKGGKPVDDIDGPADKVVSVAAALAKTSKKKSGKASQKRARDDVGDIVDALLGGSDDDDDNDNDSRRQKDIRQKNKKSKKTKKSAKVQNKQPSIEEEEEEAVEYDDDDVAELYAWNSDDEEDQKKPLSKASQISSGSAAAAQNNDDGQGDDAAAAAAALQAERQRVLRLAMSVADDTEKHKSDMPKDENEWFDRLDEEKQQKRQDRNPSGSKKSHATEANDSDDDLPSDLVRASRSNDSRSTSTAAAAAVVRVPKEKREAIGKFLAIDCEMVGAGFKGSRSMLARVSIVNYYGHVILDTFVQPTEEVTDYRTWVSGIRKQDMEGGRPFKEVQQLVSDLTKDRILVGHAIKNDLGALMLSHPPSLIRDTAFYPEFRQLNKGAAASLRMLAASVLNINIQEGEHSSVVDAKTTMLLYRKVKDRWEKELAPRRYRAKMLKEKSKARFEQLRREIDEQRSQLKSQQEQNLRAVYKQQ
ncbi:3'-5' exonuclease [Coemansia sp. RSA 1722]|nr:3'-5' exonuclease [Coemansia sp. RSA 486]KAJ2238063.1 3'-5' exonuclease [Coemansia sp. RSA 485]KAJ2606180.1 3'-5' exonuclease [Coemansia sp. RSA 1722]KAJ2639697.1 3'-5' exonuclease [Coemansia sp. RSA 1286]